MAKRYRKKPVVVEAVQFTGKNIKELKKFMGEAFRQPDSWPKEYFQILTPEGGAKYAAVSDYIIRDAKGEFFPVKDPIFLETYEEME